VASASVDIVTDESIPFACPRCGSDTTGRFYGPCGGCVAELRATVKSAPEGPGRREEFVPAMHVTVNAVALKDD
jgi:hypothetical protein